MLRYADMDHDAGGAARDTNPVAMEFTSKIDSSMSASFHPVVAE